MVYEPGDVQFYPAPNEDGWKEIGGEELGYRPDLDREHIYTKVMGLQLDLHQQNFIYVSNGTQGEWITDWVTRRCEKLQRFDQYTILKLIFECPEVGVERHAEFWAQRARESELTPDPTPAEMMAEAEAQGMTERLIP